MRRFVRGMSSRVVAEVDGFPIRVNETHALEPVAPHAEGSSGDLTGLRMWEAAPPLVAYLDQHRSRLLHRRSVLECGAGTGAVGIAAAKLGAAQVVLTDADTRATVCTDNGWTQTSTLEQLGGNAQFNGVDEVVTIAALRWGSQAHAAAIKRRWPRGFDTIIASDCLYYPTATYSLLAASVRALAAPSASLVLSYKVRHGNERRFAEDLLPGGHYGGFRHVADEVVSIGQHTQMVVTELQRDSST